MGTAQMGNRSQVAEFERGEDITNLSSKYLDLLDQFDMRREYAL